MDKNLPIGLFICGGTINSVPGEKGLRPAENAEEFLQFVPELSRVGRPFAVETFGNIDSSQTDPSVWTKLAMFINRLKSKYSAIVCTNGTDTMAESASAMSFVFAKSLDIPIIFTGSQLPMTKIHTDARNNLIGAFTVAQKAIQEEITEVIIYFHNSAFRANRTWKHREVEFNAFTSGTFPLLAETSASPIWEIGGPQWTRQVFSGIAIKNKDLPASEFCPRFGEGVVVSDIYPGTPPEFWIDGIRGGSCKGLVIRALGAGNIPFTNPRYDMRPVIREAVSNSIPVLISLKFPNGMIRSSGIYEAGQTAIDAGAIPTGDMVHEAAYTKFLYLMGLGHRTPEAIRQLMLIPMAGEVTEADKTK
ncbi:MAG: asparaginase domain-containing protein [bacterium]|nr:asparaginase domain-containing protein [bacterium]